MIKKTLFVLIFLNLTIQSLALEIIYDPRPPYIIEKNNTITGLVASPLIKSLEKAKINFTLKNKPAKRHLLEIKANKRDVCAVGWFKNPKREKFGKYTNFLYQDRPTGIITRKDTHIPSDLSLEDLLKITELSILIKDSFSYGKLIDQKLKNTKQKIYIVNESNNKIALMLAKKRADFMFVSYEEAQILLTKQKYKDILFFQELKGIPEGNKRYLICSKKVTDKTILRINNSLR